LCRYTEAAYSLLDCEADTGNLSLLTEGGDCKEDVSLVKIVDEGAGGGEKLDEMGAEVLRRFEEGEALKLTVLSLLGRDVVVGCDADTS
jgi:translation initiation factor 5A